jgi:hypothetical protein
LPKKLVSSKGSKIEVRNDVEKRPFSRDSDGILNLESQETMQEILECDPDPVQTFVNIIMNLWMAQNENFMTG